VSRVRVAWPSQRAEHHSMWGGSQAETGNVKDMCRTTGSFQRWAMHGFCFPNAMRLLLRKRRASGGSGSVRVTAGTMGC
jgi:hypothetical protein